MIKTILSFLGSIPTIIRQIRDAVESYKKQQRIERENKRREQIDKVIKDGDEEKAKELLEDMLSNIRRNSN